MIKFFKRFWSYLTAGANQKFNEKADPKIQLEQAILEAQDQHRRLKEHAANLAVRGDGCDRTAVIATFSECRDKRNLGE